MKPKAHQNASVPSTRTQQNKPDHEKMRKKKKCTAENRLSKSRPTAERGPHYSSIGGIVRGSTLVRVQSSGKAPHYHNLIARDHVCTELLLLSWCAVFAFFLANDGARQRTHPTSRVQMSSWSVHGLRKTAVVVVSRLFTKHRLPPSETPTPEVQNTE